MDSAERENADFSPIGIDYYDSSGAFVRNFSTSNTLKTGRILALTTDKFGFVWVGNTSNKGIQRIAPGDTAFETKDDSPIDVRGLVASGDKGDRSNIGVVAR